MIVFFSYVFLLVMAYLLYIIGKYCFQLPWNQWFMSNPRFWLQKQVGTNERSENQGNEALWIGCNCGRRREARWNLASSTLGFLVVETNQPRINGCFGNLFVASDTWGGETADASWINITLWYWTCEMEWNGSLCDNWHCCWTNYCTSCFIMYGGWWSTGYHLERYLPQLRAHT